MQDSRRDYYAQVGLDLLNTSNRCGINFHDSLHLYCIDSLWVYWRFLCLGLCSVGSPCALRARRLYFGRLCCSNFRRAHMAWIPSLDLPSIIERTWVMKYACISVKCAFMMYRLSSCNVYLNLNFSPTPSTLFCRYFGLPGLRPEYWSRGASKINISGKPSKHTSW